MLYPLDKSSSVTGAYPHQEDAFEHTLELLEVFSVEAAGVGQVAEKVFPLFTQDDIRKVVIFINDEVEQMSQAAGGGFQPMQLCSGFGRSDDLLQFFLALVVFPVSTEEVVQLYAAIIVEVVFQTSTSQVCFGKVKIEHLVDSLKRGGVLTDP